ncbi:hypothetical protein C2U70_18685 [Bradyrhizobium guangdongense]|uniref:tetratricopeptide repeat protein n=1 Tax=Bradyrhizobium guangdongense TaxID=1325090 RepID=UPI001127D2C6|nr:tetratricopeptide repeat protein [Bradyrhizobium guangdongense]TPQ33749.1 hypothetical protein C2U70_18685 [Bradyrhizobium guangdongense]
MIRAAVSALRTDRTPQAEAAMSVTGADEGTVMTYFDLGACSRKISTSSPEAQLWFDRGLNWVFGFNHAEAIKCFRRALEQDPDCAMAYWGVSYASGPNYNLPWDRYDRQGRQMALSASYDAMVEALALDGASRLRAMIRALPAPT